MGEGMHCVSLGKPPLAHPFGQVHLHLAARSRLASHPAHDGWHVRLALVDVVRVLMVHGVRALPRKVWHEKRRMEYEANCILQPSVV